MAVSAYRAFLANSQTLAPIGALAGATGKVLNLGLNKVDTFRFNLSLSDRMSDAIDPISTCVLVFHVTEGCVFGGPVISVTEDPGANQIQVAAKDWFYLLQRRILRLPAPADGSVSFNNGTFVTNANSWAIMMTSSASVSRVNEGGSQYLQLAQNGSYLSQLQGDLDGSTDDPEVGQEYEVTFQYAFGGVSQGVLDSFAAIPGPERMAAIGTQEDGGDQAIGYFPYGSITLSTWYTMTLRWCPFKTGLVWSDGTGTEFDIDRFPNAPGSLQSLPDCAMRIWLPFKSNWSMSGLNPVFDNFTISATGLPVLQKSYESVQACAIADSLIDLINADVDSGITVPSTPTTYVRTRTYNKYDNVGRAIEELSAMEGGFDWQMTGDTKQLQFYAAKGTDRPDVHFGYRAGPNNVAQVTRLIDGTGLANYVVATGKYGSGISSDSGSIGTYGVFEEVVSIGDFVAEDYSSTLLAVSGAEVALRSSPKHVFSIAPIPAGGAPVPQPFVDYEIGDTVYFSGRVGRFDVQAQAFRVFGLTIAIDDDGVERVQELKVTYA